MKEVEYTLITGAAKRVGRAIALHLAEHGHDIAVHYHHSLGDAETLKGEIEALGRKALLVQADLGQSEEAGTIITSILEVGRVRAVVNNASIFEQFDLRTTTVDAWQRHLAVNLTAPLLISQAYAETGTGGRIVNLLDWRVARSDPNHLPYAVSKAALEALTRNLAVALAPAFQVNGLALGAVLPPSDGRDVAHLLKDVPSHRWADLSEVGEAVRFLLDGPAYITGEVITIDGGRHLV
ncbi:MAG: SDR family oxidoreductase [Sphaerochaeta sp.]|jgi:NAD(P)-dependent dehydrogenase (short-subunit alcohol dehydrogenase family)|nr:SDR family oxidoreductase [Sphaerochaeta sp.]MDX9914498.1 SDR family oxidoreductase [Sphaerochaeta sp.]